MTDQAVLIQEQAIARLRDDLRGSPDGTLRAGNRYLHDTDVAIVCDACERQAQEIARLREGP